MRHDVNNWNKGFVVGFFLFHAKKALTDGRENAAEAVRDEVWTRTVPAKTLILDLSKSLAELWLSIQPSPDMSMPSVVTSLIVPMDCMNA